MHPTHTRGSMLMAVLLAIVLSPQVFAASVPPGYAVNLQAANGKFVTSLRSSRTLEAYVSQASLDETIILVDESGKAPQSGDLIRIYPHNGYVKPMGINVYASGRPADSKLIKIVKVGGSGIIHDKDKVQFLSESGRILTFGKDIDTLTITSAKIDDSIANHFAEQRKHDAKTDDSAAGQVGKALEESSIVKSMARLGSTPNHKATNVSLLPADTAGNALKGPRLGQWNCYVDHVFHLATAGRFTILPGNRYRFESNGEIGRYSYDARTRKITWLSGIWKKTGYYGKFLIKGEQGEPADKIYLIPNGSDYSADKCVPD